MNAGFSSLTKLKAQVLPPAMRSRTDFDDALTALGLGVAAMMARFCDRTFERATGATFRQSANNVVFTLPRYPLESVSSAVVTHADGTTDDVTADLARIDLPSGTVCFEDPPGRQLDVITFTFAGGFWWDTTEDASGTLPSGATALPADVQLAFFVQMRAVCKAQDLFGTAAVDGDSKAPKRDALELMPAVQSILNPHRRFA